MTEEERKGLTVFLYDRVGKHSGVAGYFSVAMAAAVVKLMEPRIDRLSSALAAAEAKVWELREALGDLISDAEKQVRNPSHHMPFSLPKAKAALASTAPAKERK